MVLACLLAGCADPAGSTREPTMTDSADKPVPRTVTPGDDGTTYRMRLEQSSKLVVPDPMAPEPRVEGRSVMVVEVLNIQPTGKREWELQAVEPGRTVLYGARPYPYTITLDVVP
jgi:hypothetical protein